MSTKHTEADLEAKVHAVIRGAFPWLGVDAIRHQTRFFVKLGRAEVEVDGLRNQAAIGRADIVIIVDGKPLCVLELKRQDLPLTADDDRQGLSYARLLEPMAPFVVVSNGKETRIVETYTGEVWAAKEGTAQELQTRLANVGKLAAAHRRQAVDTLMGADAATWPAALHAVSLGLVEDRSGEWTEPLVPFVRGFLIPRRASVQVAAALNRGYRVVVVQGPPLSGKSNVLRELVESNADLTKAAFLLLEPNSGGVFKALAALLASELDWSISEADARDWLRTISMREGPHLVLGLDGIDPSHDHVIADLEDLATERFGKRLRMVLAIDDSAVDRVTKKANRREATALGRAAMEVPVKPLSDVEFAGAVAAFAKNRISITRGGESVLSMREPWVLRILVPPEACELPADPRHGVRLPPLLDVEAIDDAAAAFADDSELNVVLRSVARAVLTQYTEIRKPEAVLHGIATFAVTTRLLEEEVGERGMQELLQRGIVKAGFDWADEPVWFIRLPALIAGHVASVIAERASEWGDPDEVAKRLVVLASKMPLGDVIAAQAVCRRLVSGRDGGIELLDALLRRAPNRQALTTGSRIAFALHGAVHEATVLEGGKLSVSTGDRVVVLDVPPNELSEVLDQGGWVILSHVASLHLGVRVGEDPESSDLDAPLLLELGKATSILTGGAEGEQGFKGIAVHELPEGSMICHEAGVVEPVTWAMVKFLIRHGPDATEWVQEAVSTQSQPLISRLHIALSEVTGITDERGTWAKRMLDEHVSPAIHLLPGHH